MNLILVRHCTMVLLACLINTFMQRFLYEDFYVNNCQYTLNIKLERPASLDSPTVAVPVTCRNVKFNKKNCQKF